MTAKLDLFAAAPKLMKTWFGASAAINAGLEPSLAHLVKILWRTRCLSLREDRQSQQQQKNGSHPTHTDHHPLQVLCKNVVQGQR